MKLFNQETFLHEFILLFSFVKLCVTSSSRAFAKYLDGLQQKDAQMVG